MDLRRIYILAVNQLFELRDTEFAHLNNYPDSMLSCLLIGKYNGEIEFLNKEIVKLEKEGRGEND